MDAAYVLRSVRHAQLDTTLYELRERSRDGSKVGVNITLPYKSSVLRHVDVGADVVADEVQRTGSANTIVFRNGIAYAHNTDIDGYAQALTLHGIIPAQHRCMVIGAGGAARAVVDVLTAAGCDVRVCSRTRPTWTSHWLAFSDADDVLKTWRPSFWTQATSAAVLGTESDLFALLGDFAIEQNAIAVDLNYRPSAWQQWARARGLRVAARFGFDMLCLQAVRAQQHFWGLSDVETGQLQQNVALELAELWKRLNAHQETR